MRAVAPQASCGRTARHFLPAGAENAWRASFPPIPPFEQYVHLVTSACLLLPWLVSSKLRGRRKAPHGRLLALMCFAVYTSSNLHWAWYAVGSWRQVFDVSVAATALVAILGAAVALRRRWETVAITSGLTTALGADFLQPSYLGGPLGCHLLLRTVGCAAALHLVVRSHGGGKRVQFFAVAGTFFAHLVQTWLAALAVSPSCLRFPVALSIRGAVQGFVVTYLVAVCVARALQRAGVES